MKYNCPRCKKEFSLSAKLAGKQLRIRCTACGTVFRMRLAASPSGAQAAPAVAPSLDATASAPVAAPAAPKEPQHKYFAVIGGKRLGPMPFAALSRLVAENKIDARTLLWRKGLDEWLPANKLADIASLFPQAGPPPLPPRPAGAPQPPPLTSRGPVEDAVEAAARQASLQLEQEAMSLDPAQLAGKVSGEVLGKLQTSQPDEEPTDQEVDLDDVDNAFFSVGERSGEAAQPSRDIGEIELSDGPLFPVEMEAQQDAKGAKASLKDFSVMVTLSRRSRAKSVFALVTLGVVAAAAIVLIFTFGDPLGWQEPQKQEVEWHQAGHKGLLAEGKEKARQAAPEEARKVKAKAPADDLGEDPEELIRKMEQKEWKVTLDEDEMAVDRDALATKLGDKPKAVVSSGKKSTSHGSTPRLSPKKHGDDGEMSLEEFANSHALSKGEAGSAMKAGKGGANVAAEKTVGEGMDSAMGNLLGGNKLQERKVVANVKERAGDGSALKALVARRVSKKVGAERTRIKSCMDRHSASYSGPGGQLKASLHFTDKGTVNRVSIVGGGAELEKCFADIFAGWSISTINRKIKIPIAVRFQ